jgi:hypothetical protein
LRFQWGYGFSHEGTPAAIRFVCRQHLVAFTIEFDNEFERLVPHRTTNHGSTGGSSSVPWLVSMAMRSQFMRAL